MGRCARERFCLSTRIASTGLSEAWDARCPTRRHHFRIVRHVFRVCKRATRSFLVLPSAFRKTAEALEDSSNRQPAGSPEAGADRYDVVAGSHQRAYKGQPLVGAFGSRAGYPFTSQFCFLSPGVHYGIPVAHFQSFHLFSLTRFPRLRGSQQCTYRPARHSSGTAAIRLDTSVACCFLFFVLSWVLHLFLLLRFIESWVYEYGFYGIKRSS